MHGCMTDRWTNRQTKISYIKSVLHAGKYLIYYIEQIFKILGKANPLGHKNELLWEERMEMKAERWLKISKEAYTWPAKACKFCKTFETLSLETSMHL